METKVLKVAQFDDQENWLKKVNILFKIKDNENDDIVIKHKEYKNHQELLAEINNVEKVFNYDYLILDIYDKDKDENVAIDILNSIKANNLNIKVILFSLGSASSGAVHNINYSFDDYPFLMFEDLIPKASIDKMIQIILEDFLENNISPQFDYLYKDDILLKAEINSIGEKYISLIIRNIRKKKEIKTPILIERMTSGFSGASVFKLHIKNKISILKVSKDKNKLEEEFWNAEKYYKELPPAFRIEISDRENYSNNGVAAYLIENVPNGETLFNFLKKERDESTIHSILEKLFINDNSLKSFYSKNKIRKEKYYFINEKFDEIRYSKVKMALDELKPLLDTSVSNRILDYIADNKYDKIRPDGTIKENSIVICHGDFHSKNIMISSKKNPTIIDTGGMKEDYWCMDICRLITNLFIEGIDINTRKYYDINEISNQVKIAKNIINLKDDLKLDGINDGFIIAINWLINNIQNIYGEMFCKWEYQLGLFREFIQISYRKNSIPPNKRAIAILSTKKCLESANELFE